MECWFDFKTILCSRVIESRTDMSSQGPPKKKSKQAICRQNTILSRAKTCSSAAENKIVVEATEEEQKNPPTKDTEHILLANRKRQ